MQIFVSVPEQKWKKKSIKKQTESRSSMDLKRKVYPGNNRKNQKGFREVSKTKRSEKSHFGMEYISSGNRGTIKTTELSS